MPGPSCLCGHFDDCPACHEENYRRHQVFKLLAEMPQGERCDLIEELCTCMDSGGELRSELKRISGVEVVMLDWVSAPKY